MLLLLLNQLRVLLLRERRVLELLVYLYLLTEILVYLRIVQLRKRLLYVLARNLDMLSVSVYLRGTVVGAVVIEPLSSGYLSVGLGAVLVIEEILVLL